MEKTYLQSFSLNLGLGTCFWNGLCSRDGLCDLPRMLFAYETCLFIKR